MKITELIKKLEEIKAENGDIEVVVKYRDDGGEYIGHDETLYLTIVESKPSLLPREKTLVL